MSFKSNSSNTSRRTSSDFRTPRRVEIARRSRAFLMNFEVFWNRRKSYLRVFERTSQTISYFSRKSRWNFDLFFVISSSDCQTSFTLLIFFVLGSWNINEFRIIVTVAQENEKTVRLIHFILVFNLQAISLADLESFKVEILKIVDTNKDGKVSRDELALLLSAQ